MALSDIIDGSATNIFLKLIASIIILIAGIIIARIASKLVNKLLKELELERILNEQVGLKVPISEFVSSIVKYIIYFAAIIMALNQLGVTTIILYILLAVILVAIVAFIILAFKDFVPNLAAGVFIFQKKIIEKGDRIKLKDFNGRVEEINLIETKIKTSKGELVYIPNSLIIKNEIVKLKK